MWVIAENIAKRRWGDPSPRSTTVTDKTLNEALKGKFSGKLNHLDYFAHILSG